MKKFFWALMLAFAAVSFVACDEKEEPKEDVEEVCDKCGQDPCVCEDEPVEEVCEECGKNPCECEDDPAPAPSAPDWCDYYFSYEHDVNPTSMDYVVAEYDFEDIVTEDGKHVWDLLGYESFAAMAEAMGTIDERKASNDNELVWYGYDATTGYDIETPGNTNGFGHWYSLTGSLDAWATETVRCYIENDGWYNTGEVDAEGEAVWEYSFPQTFHGQPSTYPRK